MDVVIAGAGVGGLALTRGLLADGHRVRVLEQAAELRRGGAAVTVFSNGAAAMARLGIPPLDGLGGRIDLLDFRVADGRRFAAADLRVLHRHTGFPVVTTPRERLIAHLAAGLPDGVVQFDHGVVDVAVETDGVRVTDSRGVEHRADVLVGADGYRSAVRQAVLDRGAVREVGWSTWQGLTKVLPDVAEAAAGWGYVGRAGMCGIMPAGDGLVQWWFDVRDPGPGDQADVTGWLRRHFAAYVEPVPTLLDSISDNDVGRYPHVLHTIPDRWGAGPTTLLRDAVHAFPPSQAQGANQTLEDAWMIAHVLHGAAEPTAALREYERRRLRKVRLVSRLAATESTINPPAALVRLTRHVPPSLMGRLYLAQLRRFSTVLHEAL